MKKAFLTLAVVAAVALVSCNNKAKEEAADANAADTAILVEEEAIEIVSDTVAAPAADTTATVAVDSTAAK